MRRAVRIVAVAGLAIPASCSPAGFGVTACRAGDDVVFRIAPMRDGWFSTYQPRPTSIMVMENGTDGGAMTRSERLWYTDPDPSRTRGKQPEAPERRLIVYGERIDGWQVPTAPQSLKLGRSYIVDIQSSVDGDRRGGGALFRLEALELC